jgi:hypothetical protein
MPSFKPFLNDGDVAAIRAYLVSRRNELAKN